MVSVYRHTADTQLELGAQARWYKTQIPECDQLRQIEMCQNVPRSWEFEISLEDSHLAEHKRGVSDSTGNAKTKPQQWLSLPATDVSCSSIGHLYRTKTAVGVRTKE